MFYELKNNFSNVNKSGIVEYKETIKLKDLFNKIPHIIVGAKVVNDMFEEAVQLVLEQFNCFLPRRIM